MKETERMYLCLSQERIIQFQVKFLRGMSYLQNQGYSVTRAWGNQFRKHRTPLSHWKLVSVSLTFEKKYLVKLFAENPTAANFSKMKPNSLCRLVRITNLNGLAPLRWKALLSIVPCQYTDDYILWLFLGSQNCCLGSQVWDSSGCWIKLVPRRHVCSNLIEHCSPCDRYKS